MKDKIVIKRKEKECIFCFFKSEKHKELRKLCQLQEERFEKILEEYRNLFKIEFSVALKNNICDTKHSNSDYILKKILEVMKSNENELLNEINDFFERLIEVYKEWISGKAYNSIGILKELLKKYELAFDYSKDSKKNNNRIMSEVSIQDRLFFRGRWAKDSIFNSYDMFHIPYDKRYLVNNQRFSLSGYPLLYLNNSIDGIVKELDITEDNFNDFVFSSFYFNNKAIIYSLSNPFKEYYNSYDDEYDIFFVESEITKNEIKRKLFKFILSSICCFEKRIQHKEQEKNKKYIFYEEYVIPQALTQVLRLYGYNGIFYPSTRVSKMLENGLYDEKTFNLAYFPEYQKKHYDNVLYNNLNISVPISYKNISTIKDSTNVDDYPSKKIIERNRNLFIIGNYDENNNYTQYEKRKIKNIIKIHRENMIEYNSNLRNINDKEICNFEQKIKILQYKLTSYFVLKSFLKIEKERGNHNGR